MILTTKLRVLEAHIETWPEWIWNTQPLKFFQMLLPTELSCHELDKQSQPTICISSIVTRSVFIFIPAIALIDFDTNHYLNFALGITCVQQKICYNLTYKIY